jgi:serine/threonine-protein kinase
VASVGQVIGGRFRVDRLIGSGGMGLVVAATHLELGHRVAIKFLRDDVAANPTVVERFLREARAVVHLRTEHVCRVSDVGRTDAGAPYMVMEMLEGSDLGKVVARQPLPLTIAVEYVLQASVAVAEAHAGGIVHRDLKPANLFLSRRPGGGPLVKVLDFGIAKAVTEAGAQLTRSHSMLGSPAYISPEQLQSARDVDPRTDIWALGATLYQLLTARLPFHRPTAAGMAVRIMMEPPDPIDTDPALRAVVLRCLEKQPAQRYPDVAALAADLARFGGPSGGALAGLVAKLLRGDPATLAGTPMLAYASTAAGLATASAGTPKPPAAGGGTAIVPAAGRRRDGMPVAHVAGTGPGAMQFAHAVTPLPGVPARRRHLVGWLGAPLIVLASAGVALIVARAGTSATPVAGSAASDGRVAAVAPVNPPPTPAAPIDSPTPAAPMPAPVAPASAGAAPLRLPPDPGKPKAAQPRTVRPRAAAPAPPTPPTAAGPASSPSSGGRGSSGSVVGTAKAAARDAKDTCLEATADAPWNTAMCWCTKKDRARAQAAYAKLSGFKRFTVREFCAVRGIDL